MKSLSGKILGLMITALLTAGYSPFAQAAAIQSMRDAASFEMFMPADRPSEPLYDEDTSDGIYEPELASADDDGIIGSATVNYNQEIARALFADKGDDVVIEIDSTTRRIFVPEGRNVIIRLREAANNKWHYECEELLNLASNHKNGNERQLVFNAEETGITKLWLDCVDNSGKEIKVVESRYINVIVG